MTWGKSLGARAVHRKTIGCAWAPSAARRMAGAGAAELAKPLTNGYSAWLFAKSRWGSKNALDDSTQAHRAAACRYCRRCRSTLAVGSAAERPGSTGCPSGSSCGRTRRCWSGRRVVVEPAEAEAQVAEPSGGSKQQPRSISPAIGSPWSREAKTVAIPDANPRKRRGHGSGVFP